jgi:hypothetical protein
MKVAIVLANVIRKTISRIVVMIVIEKKVQNYAALFPEVMRWIKTAGKAGDRIDRDDPASAHVFFWQARERGKGVS